MTDQKNIIHPTVCLYGASQHVKADQTKQNFLLRLGENNVIREFVVIHGGLDTVTVIGKNNFIMAQCVINHDCQIMDKCVLSTGVILGGYCKLMDGVNMGQSSSVHQHTIIGSFAMVGMGAVIIKHIPPFTLYNPKNGIQKLNLIGLRRNGFSEEEIHFIWDFYRLSDCWSKIDTLKKCPSIMKILNNFQSSVLECPRKKIEPIHLEIYKNFLEL